MSCGARLILVERAMDEAWQKAFVTASERWPSIRVSELELELHLERLGAGEEPPIHAAEVYVCCACALGRPEARLALVSRHGDDLEALVTHLAGPRDLPTVLEDIQHQLFDAAPPLVADYSGRVPLASWLRVTALRRFIASHRARTLDSGAPELPGERDVTEFCLWLDVGPSDAALGAGSLQRWELALTDALDALPQRDRTLLRLHVLYGVSIAALSKAYQLSKSSLRERISEYRERLLSDMCDRAWVARAANDSIRGRRRGIFLEDDAASYHSSVQRSQRDGDSGSSSPH
ncbi:MAG: hypothetical protein ABI895_09395 [Deltaproteobacteria bacterium]